MFENLIKTALRTGLNKINISTLTRNLKNIITQTDRFGASSTFEAILLNLKSITKKFDSMSERDQKNINNLILLSTRELDEFASLFDIMPSNVKTKSQLDQHIKQNHPSLYELAHRKI